jgi:2-oxoisovalerate dehydrogenase E2 component (dihydrolipoyl transacylase)
MGNYTFRLPDVGEGVAEAEIVTWHIKVGDHIKEDESTVDVMTDKATVEMTTPVTGRVTAIHGEIGQRVPVGSPLIELETGEDVSEPENREVSAPPPTLTLAPVAPVALPNNRPAPPELAMPNPQPPNIPAFAAGAQDDSPLASPATRRRAWELGVALQFVPGTGPSGRITSADLEAYMVRGTSGGQTFAGDAKRTGVNEVKIVGLRRKIAEKMQEAKRRIPHFSYVEEFDLTELEGLRRDLNTESAVDRPRVTLLPFFMRALVKLLPDFPQINARYDDDAGILRLYDGVHIGIATQTPGGLMVPVVRHTEARDVFDCARELARVTTAAREGKATRDELTGSTITLTSLGALGGISATPVINHPEVAIIGPNKLVDRPVVLNGQVAIRMMMNLSSSFDHRIVDGYDAARFIQGLKRLIERPALLFMDQA